MEKSNLKQLIPGNPGTSFVTALLYALQKKYQREIDNNEQLSLFTKGIVHSRNVFFSGVINEIAKQYKRPITFLSNSVFILKQADAEIEKEHVFLTFNALDTNACNELLNTYQYIVLSVDIFEFRNYHDYHFVCISRKDDTYVVFEPKSGEVIFMNEKEIEKLVVSISVGLKDILMCFVI